MADIYSKILSKYSIDINQTNIYKIYKIDNADISSEELEEKIANCRKKWHQSINGANEKFAERDRAYLKKADLYEAILRDKKLSKELFAYYGQETTASEARNGGGLREIGFAKEYFSLVSTTKKIRKKDIEFFFTYYREERKNKKAILEMLNKEFNVMCFGKEKTDADENKEAEENGKKKNDSSPLIVNLFQEATLLKIHKCEGFYQKASESTELSQRYPTLMTSLFEYLCLEKIEDLKGFKKHVSEQSKEIFAQKQDKGQEYATLVDMFNTLNDILDYRDVVDNFQEFKLLLKYPKLTPYMYEFEEMNQSTLKGILDVANKEYVFRDLNDFILSYFQIIYDNFNIQDSKIRSTISKAKKKANKNKILNSIGEKFGRKMKRKVPVAVSIIHWLVYWPIFALRFVFEVCKVVCTVVKKLFIPIFLALFILSNWLFPKVMGIDNLLIFGRIIHKAEWYSFINSFLGEEVNGGFVAIILSLITIIVMLMIYVIPSFLITDFVYESARTLHERVDWVGLERTFQNIFQILRKKTKDQYLAQKKMFIQSHIPKIIINAMCLISVLLIVRFTPIGFKMFSSKIDYFERSESIETTGDASTADIETKETMVITEGAANIRSGPGTDYDAITIGKNGDTFVSTGNTETASNGRKWYEIYLDEEMSQTGWASEKVMEYLKQSMILENHISKMNLI